MYDYSVSPYSTSADLTAIAEVESKMGALAGFSAMYTFICLAVGIFSIICMWKVFTKAGKPGWASIVPIYNMVVMFQIAGMSPWMILLMLVPIANVIVMIILYVKFAQAFGKGGGFACGLIFLNIIFMAMLAFGKSEYVG